MDNMASRVPLVLLAIFPLVSGFLEGGIAEYNMNEVSVLV